MNRKQEKNDDYLNKKKTKTSQNLKTKREIKSKKKFKEKCREKVTLVNLSTCVHIIHLETWVVYYPDDDEEELVVGKETGVEGARIWLSRKYMNFHEINLVESKKNNEK